MKIQTIKKNSGISILETILYVSLLAIISIVVTNAMITMMKSFKEVAINSEIADSGKIAERISREIRQANSVTEAQTSPNPDLTLQSKDEDGISKVVEFTFENPNNLKIVEVFHDGSSVGNLNTTNIKISNVSFVEISATNSKAVRFSFTATSVSDPNRSYDFENTVILRGSY